MAAGSALHAALTPKPGEVFFTVRFSLEGHEEVARGLRALEARVGDLSPAWPEVDNVMRAIAAQSFRSEGAQSGSSWPQLKKRTQDARRRRGISPAHPILQAKGDMARSLTGVTSDSITVHEAAYYAFGTADPKYPYHTSPRPRTKIPLRRVFNLTADQKQDVLQPVRVYLRGGDPTTSAQRTAQTQSRLQQGAGALL